MTYANPLPRVHNDALFYLALRPEMLAVATVQPPHTTKELTVNMFHWEVGGTFSAPSQLSTFSDQLAPSQLSGHLL